MVTNNSWNSEDPAQVSKGGTGDSSHTAYAVICGGTTSTNPLQSVASVGSAGEVLTSNGAGMLPTFQSNSSIGAWHLIESQTASADTELDFVTGITGFELFAVCMRNIHAGSGGTFYMLISVDGGANFIATNYAAAMNVLVDSPSLGMRSMGSTTSVHLCGTNDTGVYDARIGPNRPLTGIFYLENLVSGNGEITCQGNWSYHSSSTFYIPLAVLVGVVHNNTAVNALRFGFVGGGTFSGSISLYGIET